MAKHADPEARFQKWIERYARARGWTLQFHVLRGRVRGGRWVTNTSSSGVPDLWLIRPSTGQLVVLEVKAPGGRSTPEQEQWIAGLQAVETVEAYVVRPADVDEIVALLDSP